MNEVWRTFDRLEYSSTGFELIYPVSSLSVLPRTNDAYECLLTVKFTLVNNPYTLDQTNID